VATDNPSFADVERELVAAGYERGAPHTLAAVDSQIATCEPCAECGSPLVTYAGFWRAAPESYRAFWHCLACQAFGEF
jgi:hypothetical protein